MSHADLHGGHVTLVTMARAGLSESIQDYLKSDLQAPGRARPSDDRRAREGPGGLTRVGVRDGEEARGARAARARAVPRRALTASGERVALEVIRHHRLLELYLAETLGLHVDAVHDEADRLEHVISEELEARIDRALGFPTHDPHGDPIPDANLEWP